jgi:hypothetical protein
MKKKARNKLQIHNSTAEFIIFTAQSGEESIEVRYEDKTVWLTQKLMAAEKQEGSRRRVLSA